MWYGFVILPYDELLSLKFQLQWGSMLEYLLFSFIFSFF